MSIELWRQAAVHSGNHEFRFIVFLSLSVDGFSEIEKRITEKIYSNGKKCGVDKKANKIEQMAPKIANNQNSRCRHSTISQAFTTLLYYKLQRSIYVWVGFGTRENARLADNGEIVC